MPSTLLAVPPPSQPDRGGGITNRQASSRPLRATLGSPLGLLLGLPLEFLLGLPLALLLGLLLPLTLCSCEDPPRPWSATPRGGVVSPPEPFLPAPTDSATSEPVPQRAPPPRRPSRVGGAWVSCYGGFRPTGVPLTDATKLGAMCGPANGMSRVGEVTQGELAPGRVVSVSLKAKTGVCYRVFAVAGAPIDDLNVVIRSPRGEALARDDSHDRWPIVEPERPFCALEDGTYSLQLSADTAGPYALAIWRLTAVGARGGG